MNYTIGHEYRYPNQKKRFKLLEVIGHVFIFENKHRVTDSVFYDLINVNSGIQVYTDLQTKLF